MAGPGCLRMSVHAFAPIAPMFTGAASHERHAGHIPPSKPDGPWFSGGRGYPDLAYRALPLSDHARAMAHGGMADPTPPSRRLDIHDRTMRKCADVYVARPS